jgi:drug/metabolite transporter (DMT)-like permease
LQKLARDRPLLGASWKIAAFACYAGLNGIAKYLCAAPVNGEGGPLSVYEVVFFQDLFALLLLVPWMLTRRVKVSFPPKHLLLHLFRVITSAIAIISWYFALIYIPLAQAVALSVIGPLLGVAGAKWFLKEKFSLLRGSIILGSLIGACLLLHPANVLVANMSNIKGLAFIGLASLFFATAKIATRKLAQLGESAPSLTVYLFIFIVPVSFIPALMHWVTPDISHWPWLIIAGLLTALAIYCVSAALVYAEVSFLAPFDLCQFILNAMVGYVVFMELPAPWAIWVVLALVGFTLSSRKKLF